MSKIKIAGHASGSGTLTIQAPDTSSSRTITLPDATCTLADNSDVTNKLPLAGGTLTGAITCEGIVTIPSSSYFIGNTASGYRFNNAADSANLLVIKDDGRGLSQFTAKAWCNFNGTGTIAFRDSHNCSSLTDNGTGNYSVSFTNNLANANYSAVANSNGTAAYTATDSHAVGSLRCLYYISGGIDISEMNIQVFGD